MNPSVLRTIPCGGLRPLCLPQWRGPSRCDGVLHGPNEDGRRGGGRQDISPPAKPHIVEDAWARRGCGDRRAGAMGRGLIRRDAGLHVGLALDQSPKKPAGGFSVVDDGDWAPGAASGPGVVQGHCHQGLGAPRQGFLQQPSGRPGLAHPLPPFFQGFPDEGGFSLPERALHHGQIPLKGAAGHMAARAKVLAEGCEHFVEQPGRR